MKTLEKWFYMEKGKFGASSALKASGSGREKVLKRGIDYHRWVYKMLDVHCKVNFPDNLLLIEPWFRTAKWAQRSPDAVLIDANKEWALVIEVKLNWKVTRDAKLLDEYVPIVQNVFDVGKVKPLLITNNLRGLSYQPLLGLGPMLSALEWEVTDPTPVMLLPKAGTP